MKNKTIVQQIISASYRNSQRVLVERCVVFIVLLIISITTSFKWGNQTYIYTAIIFMALDHRIMTRRSKLIPLRNTFLTSTLPLTKIEYFKIQLYENLFEYVFIYIAASFILTKLCFVGQSFIIIFSITLFIFIELIFVTSLPYSYIINDYSSLKKKSILKSITSVMLWLIPSLILLKSLFYLIDTLDIINKTNQIFNFSIPEGYTLLSLIIILNFIFIKSAFIPTKTPSEHIKKSKKYAPIKESAKLALALLILCIPIFGLSFYYNLNHKHINQDYYKILQRTHLIKKSTRHHIQNGNQELFTKYYKDKSYPENDFLWFKEHELYKIMIKYDRVEMLTLFINDNLILNNTKTDCNDISQKRNCVILTYLIFSIQNNAKESVKYLYPLIANKLPQKEKQHLLEKSALYCVKDLIIDLMNKGTDPNLELLKEKDQDAKESVYSLLLRNRRFKCRQIILDIM
jgi:hypothetical protein